MLRSVQVVAHPVIAAVLATAIVLGAGVLAASQLHRAQDITLGHSMVEKVSVTKRIEAAPAPALYQGPAATPAPISQPEIARTAKVSLYVASVDKAVALVSRIARGDGGDVFSSDVTNGDGSTAQPSGTMEIRVPAERFDRAMAALLQAGTVRERSTGAEDLTGTITDSGARLRNLRRTEADIRSIMDRSGSVSQIMDAENQLSQVREQIETLESELKDMRGRVAYATIDIDMQEEARVTPVQPAASSQLASAWHDALTSLGMVTVSLVAMLLYLVVFAPYFAAAAAIGWLIYVQARRRAAMR